MNTMIRDDAAPYDALLRVVIRADAFWSAMMALLAIATPIVAVIPVAPGVARWVGIGAIVAAILLGSLGAITFVLLALRMRAGHALAPTGLRLPLPAAMSPTIDGNDTDPATRSTRSTRADAA